MDIKYVSALHVFRIGCPGMVVLGHEEITTSPVVAYLPMGVSPDKAQMMQTRNTIYVLDRQVDLLVNEQKENNIDMWD